MRFFFSAAFNGVEVPTRRKLIYRNGRLGYVSCFPYRQHTQNFGIACFSLRLSLFRSEYCHGRFSPFILVLFEVERHNTTGEGDNNKIQLLGEQGRSAVLGESFKPR